MFLFLCIILLGLSTVYGTTQFSKTFDSGQPSPEWTIGKKMPTPRTEIMGDVIDKKIYIAGGVDYHKGGQVDSVEVYDTKTNKWIAEGTRMPNAIDHGSGAAYNGKLYVAGGYFAGKVPTDKLYIYDPKKDEWKEGKPLPEPSGALSAEFINSTLYVVGGLDSSQNPKNTTFAYDPKTDTWTTRAPMPTARQHLATAAIDGKLYALGGRVLGDGINDPNIDAAVTNFNNNEVYDPKTDTWSVEQPMLTKRSGFTAAAAAGQIYVFGGDGVRQIFNSVEKYDPSTNKWTYQTSMPTERMGAKATTIDDKIYVIGGQLSGQIPSDANEIFSIKNKSDESKSN
jgi:N-acetylneuraminic acid mutarotase